MGPSRLILPGIHPSVFRPALAVFLMAGLIGFLAWKLWQRQWLALFFPAWFLIVLAPVLPSRDHASEYYLTIPIIGLAMWGGWGLAAGWRAGLLGRIAAGQPLGYLSEYFAAPALEKQALSERRAVVYDVAGGDVRDITAEYRAP